MVDLQIVSPQKVAVFAVVLHSAQQATLKKQVPYVINGQHQFHFEVQAEIVPVNFSVSREDIHFAFAPDNFENTVTESLLIHNPNNHSISFWWEGGNSNFALSPMKGTLEKKNSLFVKVGSECLAITLHLFDLIDTLHRLADCLASFSTCFGEQLQVLA